MGPKASEVVLVDGERVQLRLDDAMFPNQAFVRLSPRLIAGILNESPEDGNTCQVTTRHAVYIWVEQNGVYEYLGDIVFDSQSDGSVVWRCYVTNHAVGSEQEKKMKQFLMDQMGIEKMEFNIRCDYGKSWPEEITFVRGPFSNSIDLLAIPRKRKESE